VVAVRAADPRKTFAQIAALQIGPHRIGNDRPLVAVYPEKLLIVIPLEPFKMVVEQLPQRRLLRLPRVVNGRAVPLQHLPSGFS